MLKEGRCSWLVLLAVVLCYCPPHPTTIYPSFFSFFFFAVQWTVQQIASKRIYQTHDSGQPWVETRNQCKVTLLITHWTVRMKLLPFDRKFCSRFTSQVLTACVLWTYFLLAGVHPSFRFLVMYLSLLFIWLSSCFVLFLLGEGDGSSADVNSLHR